MSLYNAIRGFNPACHVLLPILEKEVKDFPRFRDCFAGKMTRHPTELDTYGIPRRQVDNSEVMSIYLRVGGNNREDYKEEIEELQKHPLYIVDYDDSFDSTFAVFIFKIPEKYLKLFNTFKEGIKEIKRKQILQNNKLKQL